MRALLLRLYESGGVDSVREELRERLDSAAGVNINSWQAAFYRALHQSDVFCDGGFSAISAPQ